MKINPPSFTLVRGWSIVAALALAASLGAQPLNNPDVLRLGSNENPFGFSAKAEAVMTAAIKSSNYYNRDVVRELVEVLAAKEGVKEDCIYPTAGSGVALELIGMAYGAPGANLVNISPGYPQVGWSFKKFGGEVKFAPLGKNHGYDFDALAKTIDANTRIVIVCNPNNPTGALADPAALRKFIMSTPEHVLVVVDEAYLELADTALAVNTMAPMTKLKKNVVVTRTFSKAYGMAGLRAGYAIGNPEIFAKMKKFDPGAGPSFLAAIAAKEAVKDQAKMEDNRKKYSDGRRLALKQFDSLGLKYVYPQGAFVLFEIGIDSAEAREKFLKNNILVTRPNSFDLSPADTINYKNWLRVSVGTPEDMQKFFEVLKVILEKPTMAKK